MDKAKNIYRDWRALAVFNPDEIPSVTLNGAKKVKLPAMEFFAKYAEYKVEGTNTPYAPVFSYEGVNLYFFPTFCVLEVNPLTEKTTFFLFRPKVSNEFEAKIIVGETMTAYTDIQLIRDAVRFVKEKSR
jgi:hypothetical protein